MTTDTTTRLDAAALLEGTTPGEWTVGRVNDPNNENVAIGVRSEDWGIADVWKDCRELEESAAANARIMAAAPALASRVIELEAENARLRSLLRSNP